MNYTNLSSSVKQKLGQLKTKLETKRSEIEAAAAAPGASAEAKVAKRTLDAVLARKKR